MEKNEAYKKIADELRGISFLYEDDEELFKLLSNVIFAMEKAGFAVVPKLDW